LPKVARPPRIDRLVGDHLSTQGRPNPREGLLCFWCPKRRRSVSLGASNTLKIIKNGLELRKLCSPATQNVVQSRTPKKRQPLSRTKPVSNHPKIYLYVALFLLDFQDDL
jgi:hypothetical protein